MRDITEIKFRQVNANGGFHYWGYVDKRYKETFTAPIFGKSEQYSGVKDKNGDEWCEGDKTDIEDSVYGVVVFEDGSFKLKMYELCERGGSEYIETNSFNDYHMDGFEINGNIHHK